MAKTPKNTIKTRQIAILAADGVSESMLEAVKTALEGQGAVTQLIAHHGGSIKGEKNKFLPVDQSLLIAASVLFDAVYIPGGVASVATLKELPDAQAFIREAYLHAKPIAAEGEGVELVESALIGLVIPGDKGLLLQGNSKSGIADAFIKAIAQHRFWEREKQVKKL